MSGRALALRPASVLLLGVLLLGMPVLSGPCLRTAGLAAEEPSAADRLAGLALDAETCARWDARIANLGVALRKGDAGGLRSTRVALRLGGLPALARVAHALRSPTTDEHLAGQLLRVVAAHAEPEAQALLREAARAPSGGLRALAADGLAGDRKSVV